MITFATDAILALVVAEAAILVLYNRRTGRGIRPSRLCANLAAGFFLVLAVRLAMATDAHGALGQAAIGAALLGALLAHIVDLAGRWHA